MFICSEAWRSAYPAAHAGVLALRGVNNPGRHEALQARKDLLERDLRARWHGKTRADLLADPVLQAYAAYYRRFDKTYHVQLQLESIVFKGKSLPVVAALVEAMFMAELQDGLLTAGHDLEAVDPPVVLDVADGTEEYTLLRGTPQVLRAGDMYMRDGEGVLSSILHGPARRVPITPATRRALFTAYAPAGVGRERVEAHLENIRANVLLIAPQLEVECLAVFPPSLEG